MTYIYENGQKTRSVFFKTRSQTHWCPEWIEQNEQFLFNKCEKCVKKLVSVQTKIEDRGRKNVFRLCFLYFFGITFVWPVSILIHLPRWSHCRRSSEHFRFSLVHRIVDNIRVFDLLNSIENAWTVGNVNSASTWSLSSVSLWPCENDDRNYFGYVQLQKNHQYYHGLQ